jgi:hypothetical protein
MLAFDILVYVGSSAHLVNLGYNLFCYDLPRVFAKESSSQCAQASTYYTTRGSKLPYRLIALFCISVLVGVIGNIATEYDTALASSLIALLLCFPVGIVANTVLVVNVVNKMKSSEGGGLSTIEGDLHRIFMGHLFAVFYFVVIIACVALKF